ncbi:maleylacetoacetate isomerase [Alteromonas gilva]|uniref:Maleylacetoacetate isomerase n=1 Tax=Alteromonas gilva TaxID=2987522 RepID=A0ABT5KZR3_9ALTE|nr:maleylacetoacetate isomerase [Alteromonas gilva]MDC8830264.1 maleylacetoacetate isomerase [Alteromonas gilva]
MQLYSYFRSSAAYRLRIALNLKGIKYEQIPINLVTNEHRSSAYLKVNNQGLVPALKVNENQTLVQSGAILEWLEENHPQPPLYPSDNNEKAKLRGLCQVISCDIHPLNNLRVLRYLRNELGLSEQQKTHWYQHWIAQGFEALEAHLVATPYAMGMQVTMLDIFLIPQVYNALRFGQDMSGFANIMAVYNACNELDVFRTAAPEVQVDAS